MTDLLLIGLLVSVLALLVLVIGLLRRVSDMGEDLEALEELEEMRGAVSELATEVQRRDLHEQLRSRLTEVTESHRRLSAGFTRLEEAVREQAAAAAEPAAPAAPVEETDPTALVIRHLTHQGFERVQVLTELSRIEGRSGRVAFEARKGGVMHKGHASVDDGRVVEEKWQSAYSAFP